MGGETGTIIPVTQTQNIQTRSTRQVETETAAAAATATAATTSAYHPPPVYLATHYAGTLSAPAGTVAQAIDAISPTPEEKFTRPLQFPRNAKK